MNVYISVDMEGVAGVATADQVNRGGNGYARAQALMTAETNAAIEGAFAAGAEAVTVSDSHGSMDNLLHEALDPRARLVFGKPRAQCMVHGLTGEFDIALFVGYHAGAGSRGTLAHTFSSFFAGFELNGQPVTEAEVNALFAASVGVPVGLVTGDEEICAVSQREFKGVTAVPVKSATGWTAADTIHPRAAVDAIRAGATAAVSVAGRLEPVAVPDRLVLDVEMQIPTAAELAASVPGSERVGVRTVRHELADPADLLGLVTVYYTLAGQAMQETARRIV